MLGRTIRRAIVVAFAAGALWAPAASAQSAPPVLIVTSSAAPFGDYYAEILRAEGLNEFAVADLSQLSPGLLSSYHVVLLAGQAPVNSGQAGALTNWVAAGGNLIAMRPTDQLAPLLGLGGDGGDHAEGYVAVDTSSSPGAGITGTTMQFHGVADRRGLAGARQVAALYANASSPAGAPAVTLRNVGSAGGQAAAFTYDLARSVVYTRQGNNLGGPSRIESLGPTRSYAWFTNGWLNHDKVHIPQADEQQRLLANLVIQMSLDRMPLPRFWYLPHGHRAAVVMTGDDHGEGGVGTNNHFDRFIQRDPAGCSVADWQCVRATSYVYSGLRVPGDTNYQAAGFEIAMHLTTGCTDFTPASLAGNWSTQLAEWRNNFPGITSPRTNRTHCVPWSDWLSEATVARAHGVRLDTNYYYWPGSWLNDRPGLFTGSGFPQRFADGNGSPVDVYQAATQLTDESDQNLAAHIDALIARAKGPEGYYGVFTTNMHTDQSRMAAFAAGTIVAEAQLEGVPVVSAAQMLNWLDGRNGSSFSNMSYGGNRLRFSVTAGAGSRGLYAMVPGGAGGGGLTSLTRNGVNVPMSSFSMKGMTYALFPAADGNYVATYGVGYPETTITGASVSKTTARFAFVSDTPGSRFECRRNSAAFAACSSPKQYTGLSRGTHKFQVRAIDPAGVADVTPAERSVTIGKSGAGGSGGSGFGEGGGPRVRITPKRVRISANGTVRLRVRCHRSQRKCRVRLRLRANRKTVAARTFLVKGGKRRSIELVLHRSTRASLSRKRTLKVTAIAVSKNPVGDRAVTRKKITLVAR